MNENVDSQIRELYQAGVGNRTLEELENLQIDEYDLNTISKYYNDLI